MNINNILYAGRHKTINNKQYFIALMPSGIEIIFDPSAEYLRWFVLQAWMHDNYVLHNELDASFIVFHSGGGREKIYSLNGESLSFEEWKLQINKINYLVKNPELKHFI